MQENKRKLAIVSTHPIQYNAPIFRLLTKRKNIQIKVFYTWGEQVLQNKYDPGFGKEIQWDIPLLDGYDFEWMKNIAKHPGSHHFRGIITPLLNFSIENWGADAVLIFGWNYYAHLSCLRYFKRKKIVLFRGDSTLFGRNDGFIKENLKTIFLRWVYSHVDYALFVGSENKKYFKKFGLKDKQLKFVPHAVDNNIFDSIEDDSIRKKLRIDDDCILFLFSGKFQELKNPILLINAFVKIDNLKSHLLIVGNGYYENKMKSHVSLFSADIQARIHFMDFVNQSKMPQLYKNCDVFVLPSKSETWGLSINEAMASSKSVIVSNVCGCHVDLVFEGVNGFVFKNNDLDSLISKMNFFNSRSITKKMGNKSQELIRNWSLEKICEEIEAILLTEFAV